MSARVATAARIRVPASAVPDVGTILPRQDLAPLRLDSYDSGVAGVALAQFSHLIAGGLLCEALNAQVWPQTPPVGIDPPDGHRLPQGLGERPFDVATIAFDARQHEMAQRQHQQSDGEIACGAEPAKNTQERAGAAEKAGGAHGPGRARMTC